MHKNVTTSLTYILVGSIMLNLLLTAIAPVTATETEPNDSFNTATEVVKGNYTTGMTISSSSDKDYYKIWLEIGQNLSVSVWNETEYSIKDNFQIGLYNSYNNLLCWGYSETTTLTLIVQQSNYYYIRIDYFNKVGTYCLNITDYRPADDQYESNNMFKDAKVITKGSYEHLYLLDKDYFKFYLTKGENCSVLVTSSIQWGDMNMSLYDGAYAVLSETMQRSPPYCFILSAPDSGWYYLEIIPRTQYSGGNYSFDLSDVTDDAFENNDDLDHAAEVTCGPSVLCEFYDPDFYKFWLNSGENISIRINRLGYGENGLTLGLLSPTFIVFNRFTIETPYENKEVTIFNASQSGYYYLNLSSNTNGWGKYYLQISRIYDDRFEENDQFSEAVILSKGIYSDLALYDEDFYRIGLEKDESLTVEIMDYNYNEINLRRYTISLYDSSRTLLKSISQPSYAENIHLAKAPATGTYYLRLSRIGNNYNNYSLTLKDVNDDRYEKNENPTTAPLLNRGFIPSLALYDTDCYNVSLAAGENLSVSLATELFFWDYTLKFNFSLFAPNGALLDKRIITQISTDLIQIGIINALAGIYLVKLEISSFQYLNYSLVLGDIVDDRYEPNDDISVTPLLVPGSYDNLILADSSDYYNLSLGINQIGHISLTQHQYCSGGSFGITVLDPSGNIIRSQETSDLYAVITWESILSGTYSIKIEPLESAWGNYSLSVRCLYDDRFENNEDWAHSALIAKNTTYYDLVLFDVDYFNIILDAGDRLSLLALPALTIYQNPLIISIFDPNLNLIDSKDQVYSELTYHPNWLHFGNAPVSGQYFIVVQFNQTNLGNVVNYSLYIKEGIDDIYEQNDNFETAFSISEMSFKGYDLLLFDEDWYKLHTRAGETLVLVIWNNDHARLAELGIELYNSDHEKIPTALRIIQDGYMRLFMTNYSIPSEADYYVRIFSKNEKVEQYNFLVWLLNVTNPADITYREGSGGHIINWTVHSPILPYNASIYRDGIIQASRVAYYYENNDSHWISVDNLPFGKYKFRIEVVDMFNNSVFDEVWVTVLPASNAIPILTSPDDLQLMVNTSTTSITWSVQDPQCCDATYSIYRNGTLIQNGSWISHDLISISVASLPIGTYNFTIVVDDGFEGGVSDTVIVTILPTPNSSEPEPNFWENLKIEYIAIISFCGVGVILLILRLKKR